MVIGVTPLSNDKSKVAIRIDDCIGVVQADNTTNRTIVCLLCKHSKYNCAHVQYAKDVDPKDPEGKDAYHILPNSNPGAD